MARLIRAMYAATAVMKLASASNSCAGLRKNSNTLTTIGLFLWQPMLRWAARIAAILPTTARDFSDSWRAEDEFGRVHHGHAVLEIIPGVAGSEAGLNYPSP